jgi:hypothetical protein
MVTPFTKWPSKWILMPSELARCLRFPMGLHIVMRTVVSFRMQTDQGLGRVDTFLTICAGVCILGYAIGERERGTNLQLLQEHIRWATPGLQPGVEWKE